MDLFDPRRSDALPHAGTFNNNVLTMSAGYAGLTNVYTPDAAHALNARGDALRERLNALCRKAGVAVQFTGMGSMMAVHFTASPVRNPGDSAKADQKLKELFFFDMLAHGIWLDAQDRRALRNSGAQVEHRRILPLQTMINNLQRRFRQCLP